MRIVPIDDIDLSQLDTVAAMVRIVPFEGEFIPHFALMTREEAFESQIVPIDELVAIQDGLYQAANKIDGMIHYLISQMKEEKLKEFKRIADMMLQFEQDYVIDSNEEIDQDFDESD